MNKRLLSLLFCSVIMAAGCTGHGPITPIVSSGENVRTASSSTSSSAGWRLRIAASLSEREGAALAYDPADQALLLFGGDNSAGVQQDTWTWDAHQWTRRLPPVSPPARTDAAIAYDAMTKTLVLFGGDPHSTAGYLNDTWTWNGSRWTLLQPGISPPARTHAMMAYDPANGAVILFGGLGSSGFLNDVWSFNGTSWHELHPIAAPSARYDAAFAYHAPSRKLVLFGGFTPGSGPLGDTWTFDGTIWQQAGTVIAPVARQGASLIPMTAGTLVLFGGYTNNSLVGILPHQAIVPSGEALGDTWTWNGTAWSMMQPASSPPPRYDVAASFDPMLSQPILVAGCCNAPGGFLDDVWAYDGSSWSRHDPINAPAPRMGSVSIYDPSHATLLLFGGYGGDGFLADTWTYTSAGWNHIPPSTSPPARFAASAAYYASQSEIIVFGGQGSSATGCTSGVSGLSNPNHLCDDTWAWNGQSWSQLTMATHPSYRSLASMADNPANGQVLLYGGTADLGTLGDTWSFSAGTWSQLHPTVNPGQRYGAAFAYDPVLRAPVLFGGNGFDTHGNPAYLNDTWIWTGTNWRQLNPAGSPPARYAASFSFDTQKNGLVLYGGWGYSGMLSDTWLFVGGNWQQLASSGPPRRDFSAFAYDTALGGAVLFGGSGNDGLLNDTWSL